jgi:K+-sensing histidine kinase KdpD
MRHTTLLETAQMASHDLRKPVAALKNILSILKKEGAPHLKKNLREALGSRWK